MALFWHLLLYQKQSKCKGTKRKTNSWSCLTEVYSPDAVSNSVQWRRPTHDSHDVGDHQQYCTGHTGLGRQAHLGDESKRLDVVFVSSQQMKKHFLHSVG